MKVKHRLVSLVTSLALICSLAVNAAAAPAPAVTEPTITLSAAGDAATASVQAGDTIDLTASVTGTMAGLTLNAAVKPTGLSLSAVTAAGNTGFATTTTPQKQADGTFSALVLYGSSLVSLNNCTVATYTFKAEKVGSYTVSLSGAYSDENGADSTLTKAPTLHVTVNARTLTADASGHSALTGTYGVTYSDLAKAIQSKDVTFTSSEKAVSGVAGTWSYTGSGDHPAVGTSKASFTFTPNDASYAPASADFSLSIQPKELTPKLTVKPAGKMYDGTTDLAEDQNASISLSGVVGKDEVSASYKSIAYDQSDLSAKIITASDVSLSGKDAKNYILSANSCTANASITPYTGEITVENQIGYRSYTGEKQPITSRELVLKLGDTTLVENTDYTISYSADPIGSQAQDTTITYTVKGIGRFAGCQFHGKDTLTGSFTIYKLPLPTASGSLGNDITISYNDSFTPPSLSNISLPEYAAGGKLSLCYCTVGSGVWSKEIPTMPGTYHVNVWYDGDGRTYGSGVVAGVFSITLTIQKLAGSGSVTMQDYTYGSTPSQPQVSSDTNGTGSVTYTYTGRDGTEYQSTQAPAAVGKYTVTATFAATDLYEAAEETADFTVSPKALSDSDFSLSSKVFTYNGAVQKPALNTSLKEGTDYTVSAPDSVNAGEHTLAVTGKGNYTGEIALSYQIQRATGSASVTMQNYAYGSTPSQPQVSSDTNGTDSVTYTYTGRDGTEYQSAQAPAAVGKYTVTATFAATQNSSECTASADFEVTAKGLVADDFALDNTQFTYDGQNHTPNVTSKTALTPDTDYTVSFPESVNAGAYKVTVTGKGNYTGSVTLDYTIAQAVYTLPGDASVSTELSEYPLSIYGGQALSLVNLKASGLPEGARFGWKDGSVKLNTTAGTADYEVTVDPNDANYTAATITVSVKTADKITAGSDTSAQLSTYLTAVRKIVSDQTSLNSGVTADLTNLTLSSALTPKQQDDLKSAHLSSLDLLKALDDSVSVTVHTKLDANSKNTLTGLNIPTGGQAAAGIASGDVTYTAKDITPDQPEKGQLIEVELTLTDSSNAQKQLAAPILVELKFKAKDADPKGKFQVIHKHTESDPAKNFSTISDCSSVSKSGEEITVQFLAASLSSFSIQYTAPASSGGSSSGSSATPKPDEPQPTPTPALTQSETTWLGGYSAMLGAKSGSTLSLDVSACEYLPGYIIGGVQKTGVTLNLTTPAGKLVLTPAAAKAMNAAYNYTFADAMAIAGKTAASAAATPAPVKDPTATAATPTPQPTQAPTAAPTAQPEATPQPTEQPEQEAPAAKSHSALPIVAAIVVVALLAAGGYLAYNSASRKKAVREVYAPTKKAHSNGSGKKPNSKR